MKLQQAPQRLMVVVTWIALVSCGVLRAQYSEKVFDLKKAQELYDERGFAQGSAITVDGKLVVAESNGNVSYSYPISSSLVNGQKLDVSLNYCGSVAFTAFKHYTVATATYSDVGSLTGVSPYRGWNKFHQNRPVWLLGVNGFAVQAIAVTNNFHCDPQKVDEGINTFLDTKYTFNDSDLIWVIDGYDFCNRMLDFGIKTGGQTLDTARDVIRLLRSDGSLLELVNAERKLDSDPDIQPDLYTGDYVVAGANQKGYAVVTFDETLYTNAMASADGTLPHPLYRWAEDTVKHFDTVQQWYKPRRVAYYPGDGLEYVFREQKAPFGMHAYRAQPSYHPQIYGGSFAGPTIFYLEEINANGRTVTRFERSRHLPAVMTPGFIDSTKGRALCTGFANHTITYGNSWMMIEALGRTTTVRFSQVAVNGQMSNSVLMPLAEYGYTTPYARALAKNGDSVNPYMSYLGMVTKIVDAEGRVTSFDYQPYTRVYRNFGFPRENSLNDILVTLRNYRLEEVTEPSTRYTLEYCNGGATYVGTITDIGTTPDSVVMSSSPSEWEDYTYAQSNMVGRMKKYDRSDNLLTTDLYTYAAGLSSDTGIYREVYHMTTDEVTGHSTTTKMSFRRWKLPRAIRWFPAPHHTEVTETQTTAGDVTTETLVDYDSVNTQFLILPVKKREIISQRNIGSKLKTLEYYTYRTDTIRTYGGNDTLSTAYGQEVSMKTRRRVRPEDTTAVLLSDTTEYLNLPYSDSLREVRDRGWDKLASLARFLQKKENGEIIGEWEDVCFDTAVCAVFIDTTVELNMRLMPLYGLQTRMWRSDSAGTILGGKISSYNTEVTPGSTIDSRGSLRADTIIGRDGALLPGSYTEYGCVFCPTENLPTYARNSNGAVANLYYNYYPFISDSGSGYVHPGGKVRTNVNTEYVQDLVSSELYALAYGKPFAQQSVVRAYSDSGTLEYRKQSVYSERTFFGLARGTLDDNRWYSQFEYDHNGRLLSARLPDDFRDPDSTHVFIYNGRDDLSAYGVTFDTLLVDTTWCDGEVHGFGQRTQQFHAALYTNNRDMEIPPCPECVGYSQKSGAQTQANCHSPIPYTTTSPATGYLTFTLNGDSILTLDSAKLVLNVASVSDTCVNLVTSIPAIGFSQTTVFECPGLGNEIFDEDAPGNRFTVDLTSVLGDLRDELEDAGVTIVLNVTTFDAGMRFSSGYDAADVRPRLSLWGSFKRRIDTSDYTLAYHYDDAGLSATVSAKIDDSRHTANEIDTALNGGDKRYMQMRHVFGGDYRVLRTEVSVGAPNAMDHRTDTVLFSYTGVGKKSRTRDQEGDTVVVRYDTTGRPIETINGDGSHTTMSYMSGTPTTCGISDATQDFYGFCAEETSTREDGVKYSRYSDAFDRLRREVADSGGLHLVTKYEYDMAGRLTQSINPSGDTTGYWYNAFGRVRYKHQPDLGYVSYAYDNLGNVRFTQTEEQATAKRMTFTEYDDLNRVVVIGEMIHVDGASNDDTLYYGTKRDTSASGVSDGVDMRATSGTSVLGKHGARTMTENPPLSLNRMTDLATATQLNTGTTASILTANRTMWMTSAFAVPKVRADSTTWMAVCQLGPNILLGDTSMPTPPSLAWHVGASNFYNPRNGPGAQLTDFENMAQYPHFPRIAISYDTLPYREGPIWENFPSYADWDAIAPKGKIRNMIGREVAVASREHGGEPYHYTVLSYDERGRIEAILRYTENLGFDAVYYTYNSMNQVTALRVADPFRQHTTFYGYDNNGRIDTVWTNLEDPGSGLLVMLPSLRADSLRRPVEYRRQDSLFSADIAYQYTPSGQVSRLRYPSEAVEMQYSYDHRKRLTNAAASHFPTFLGWIFREELTYDSASQIVKQRSRKWGSSTWLTQNYFYDAISRLSGWKASTLTDTTYYTYDDVGNRTYQSSGGSNTLYMYTSSQTPNRLQTTVSSDPLLPNPSRTDYSYNLNGSVTDRNYSSVVGGNLIATGEDHYSYSYRELPWKYVSGDPTQNDHEEWRYRYNAMGEREQKRLYWGPLGDEQPNNAYPWEYYLLGGHKEQLSVWQGQQTSLSTCDSTGRRVYMYPTEYLTYGVGSSAMMTTRANGLKQYKIVDHLGSTRAVVSGGGTIGWQQDYEPYGRVLGGVLETRKGYIDKERDRESGTHNHGVRQYEPTEGGRFLSVDALWEKYRAWSPYVYSQDNPVSLVDGNGMYVDLIGVFYSKNMDGTWTKRTSQADVDAARLFILQLEKITGLKLYVDENTMTLQVRGGEANGGSGIARGMLLHAINSTDQLKVSLNIGGSTFARSWMGCNGMTIDMNEMKAFGEGTRGVYSGTLSYGMVFFHEYMHTEMGGGFNDPTEGNTVGVPDIIGNAIRRELGPMWGQRMSYDWYRLPNDTNLYIPFSADAKHSLENLQHPKSGYLFIKEGVVNAK